MQSSKLKKQTKITNPYTLKMRFFDQQGKPKEWIKCGTGQFIDLETVQRQIKVMKANYPNKAVEIEFKMDGKLLGFDGSETGETIMYARRG